LLFNCHNYMLTPHFHTKIGQSFFTLFIYRHSTTHTHTHTHLHAFLLTQPLLYLYLLLHLTLAQQSPTCLSAMRFNLFLIYLGVWVLVAFSTAVFCSSSSSLSPARHIHTTHRAKARGTAVLPSFSVRKSSTSMTPSRDSLNWTVACVTWNLQEMTPLVEDCKYLQTFRSKDLIVVGVQECENLKPRRSEGSRSRALKRQLRATLGGSVIYLYLLGGQIHSFSCFNWCVLGSTHVQKAAHKMGGLQIFVYMKKTFKQEVQGASSSSSQFILHPSSETDFIIITSAAVPAAMYLYDH
jgi:hypothetical protein